MSRKLNVCPAAEGTKFRMTQDEQHLRRAIRLAMNGRGAVEPNPMVGCVIVKNGRVIGEGIHANFGEAHAEPNALASCSESPEGATAYVTLEPCCHTNKKTPPCVPRLVAAKIARVVVGCLDPNPDVNGNGVRQLRDAGIVVESSALENVCRQLIAPFIARTSHSRPYITMKWAESADGKVAGPGGRRVRISNIASSEQVQWLRSRSDAIVVGINTVINDDPILLPRRVPRRAGYRRIVLDRNLRLPLKSQLVETIHEGPVIVCSDELPTGEHGLDLIGAGVKLWPADAWLSDPAISHVLIEPGPTLANAMLPQADRLWVIRSPKVIGDGTAPAAAAVPDDFVKTGEVDLDGDVLCEYLNTRSNVFFAPEPSADLALLTP
jgi:diaminohydroxyphosphoribosylaminopyrimidine deaminase/5-amino-6-(5-phosphoribosylamino)uracil reductase